MAATAPEGSTVRVGRWMGAEEYELMKVAQQVQVGTDGQATYVLLDGPEGFPQHKPDSIYVEFDIPANSPWWVSDDNQGWVLIPGPGTGPEMMWHLKTGQTIIEMPSATSISNILRMGN